MEFEEHLNRLEARAVPYRDSHDALQNALQSHDGVVSGLFHPDIIKAEFRAYKEIGLVALELTRMLGHPKELIKMRRELKHLDREKVQIDGREEI